MPLWLPRRSLSGDAALWTASGLCGLAVVALILAGASILWWAFLAVPLVAAGCALLVWALAYRQLSYTLSQTDLRIQWLGRCFSVPPSTLTRT